ncbi:MAG: hypothetical protein GF313_04595 [Caldithrix sp.]|nr:hypothetical protein [Caldithrix sp.]
MQRYRLFTTIFMMVLFFLMACEKSQIETLNEAVSNELALLPQDAEIYGFANIENMRESQFYDMFIDSSETFDFPADTDLEEFANETGVDLRKDIQSIYFAGYAQDKKERMRVLIISKGVFDKQKILNFIQSKEDFDKMQEQAYQSQQLFISKNGKHGFSIVDNNTAVIGYVPLMKKYMDILVKGNGQLSDVMRNRLGKIRFKNDFWITADAGNLMKKAQNPISGKQLRGLTSVEQLYFSMRINDKIEMATLGIFSDEEKAVLFKDAVKGGIATLKLALSEDRDLIDIINHIKIDVHDNEVQALFKISKEEVKKIITNQKQIAGKII